jgi:TrmH family RNA methyltransferase
MRASSPIWPRRCAAADWCSPRPAASAISTSACSTCARPRTGSHTLFGSERTGLTNAELQCAHALLRIPANAAYPSLNLGMAVQIVAYEILRARAELAGAPASGVEPAAADGPESPAPPEEMERFYVHLWQVLEQIDFRDRTQSGTHLMQRIRRLFQRAEPDGNELNILRGILTAVQQRRRRAGREP